MHASLLAIAQQKIKVPIRKSLQFGWEEFLQDPWRYILFTSIGAIINLILFQIHIVGPFALLVLGIPLQMGIAIYYYHKAHLNENGFKHFFEGFSKTWQLLLFFGFVILTLLLLLIPLFAAVTIAEASKDAIMGATSDALGWPTKVVIALYTPVIVFFSISIILSPYFIYFFELSAKDSFRISFYFFKRNWIYFLGFYLIIYLIGLLGAVTVVGLVVTTPVISLAVFHQFFAITQFDVSLDKRYQQANVQRVDVFEDTAE
jgi:hypothetical protein